MIVTVFKYLRHCRKKVYAQNLSLRYFSYIFLTSLKFSFKYLNVENISKTIMVALEVSISIFRKDHSVL